MISAGMPQDTLDDCRPRLGLKGGDPATSPKIISWKEKDWKALVELRAYVKACPQDHMSRLVYNNYLSWYARNS